MERLVNPWDGAAIHGAFAQTEFLPLREDVRLALVPRAGETLAWRNALLGNPCKGIERNYEEGRERFFSQKELAAISEALAEYDGVAADCARLIMLTGCRPAEAMKSMWSEFDTETGYWIKPSAHTKQRRVHKLPLSPAAMELIADLRKRRRSTEWVFPGDRPGQHIAAMWHLWHFVRNVPPLAKTRGYMICATHLRASAPGAA